jgi:ENTS family enterobactin (siderophore) exporter
VAVLACVAIIAEILGFSNDGILPVFASSILGLGAEGLGLLYLAVRIGSVVGLLVLVRTSARLSGIALIALLLMFGLALVGFGASTVLLPSLIFLAVAGSAAACIDAMEQSLLQAVVDDSERGRAMGLWTICLGFGPIGFVALGILAGALGAQLAQIVAGAAMALVAVGLMLWPVSVRILRGATTVAGELEPGIPSLLE